MRRLWSRLVTRLRGFTRYDDGVAAVEFALILPVLLLLYIGSVEASALISMDRRVQTVAGSLGDLVARSNKTLASGTLSDYFRAAGGLMTPYPVAGLKQIVTQVEVKSDGTTRVVWSRQCVRQGDGTDNCGVSTAYPVNSAYALAEPMVDVAKGANVIVAEATISYLPLYGIIFNKPISLYRQNFFMPRFGGTISIN